MSDMSLHVAASIIRGQRGRATREDQARAAAVVLGAVDQRHRLAIFSARLLDALDRGDEHAAEVARRRLREVLAEVG